MTAKEFLKDYYAERGIKTSVQSIEARAVQAYHQAKSKEEAEERYIESVEYANNNMVEKISSPFPRQSYLPANFITNALHIASGKEEV